MKLDETIPVEEAALVVESGQVVNLATVEDGSTIVPVGILFGAIS
jgi:hypothetical protein